MGNTKRIRLTLAAMMLVLAGSALVPGAQAENGDASSLYYATVNKGCGDSGPGCGSLVVYRTQHRSGNTVSVDLYHWECLGFRGSPYKFRWLRSRAVEVPGNRFHIKIDRPRLKLKVRGRFIGDAEHSSEVKGTVSLRNLNRKCGFRSAAFRQRETGPTTDPQG